MNKDYVSSVKQERVIPLLVTLTEEEWLDAQSFFPRGVLYYECVRKTMEDESELEHNSNFGDFIRWLFKLAPSDKDIPLEIIFRRRRTE